MEGGGSVGEQIVDPMEVDGTRFSTGKVVVEAWKLGGGASYGVVVLMAVRVS